MVLAENKLTGTLPTELGNFAMLQKLFAVNRNSFTGAIPSQLGSIVLLQEGLMLSDNRFSSIPTQLGELAEMEKGFSMYGNAELCNDLPTQVAALSTAVDDAWQVVTDTAIGTPCCEAFVNVYGECTSNPSPVPTTMPSALPTPSPTACSPGEYLASGLGCQKCSPGTFSNAPGAESCTVCAAGEIQVEEGATSCYLWCVKLKCRLGPMPCQPGTPCDTPQHSTTLGGSPRLPIYQPTTPTPSVSSVNHPASNTIQSGRHVQHKWAAGLSAGSRPSRSKWRL
jgi:hypothetical protein